MNTTCMVGRLSSDPELKKTGSDISVCGFSVAVDRDFRGASQEKITDFFDVVAWRQKAEFVAKYFKKGSAIGVVGSFQTRSYTDKNGQKRKAVELVADQVYFVERKSAEKKESYAQVPASATKPDFEEVGSEDDLPF